MTETTAPATHLANPAVSQPRAVERLVQGQATSDGAGVKLIRVLTQDLQRRLDPFLMLDAFGTDNPGDYIGGFPDHPHRGCETVTYMLQGRMRHKDSAGNEGLLSPGSVQWMTAGRGVIHSEMPEQQDGAMEGFQLWLNLPAREKMRDPWYRDIRPEEVPEWRAEGVTARVIATRLEVLSKMATQLDQPIRNIHLMGVLRSCCSLESYRRLHLADLDATRIAQFLIFTPCRCPLCLGAVFARSRCLPHRRASRVLGSHRLASSLGILFKGRFKCTYCGTRLSLVVADRRPEVDVDEAPVRFRSLAGPGRPGILRPSSKRKRSGKSLLR